LDDRLHVLRFYVVEELFLFLLGWERRYATAGRCQQRLAVGYESAEALDDAETVVAGCDGHAASALEVPEKRKDVGGEILAEHQFLNTFACGVRHVTQEEDDRVSIRLHGARAKSPLGGRPIEEV